MFFFSLPLNAISLINANGMTHGPLVCKNSKLLLKYLQKRYRLFSYFFLGGGVDIMPRLDKVTYGKIFFMERINLQP